MYYSKCQKCRDFTTSFHRNKTSVLRWTFSWVAYACMCLYALLVGTMAKCESPIHFSNYCKWTELPVHCTTSPHTTKMRREKNMHTHTPTQAQNKYLVFTHAILRKWLIYAINRHPIMKRISIIFKWNSNFILKCNQ